MSSESSALLASDGVPRLPVIISGVEDAAHTIFMVTDGVIGAVILGVVYCTNFC